ncbi:uncharacterized protein LOC130807126 [Amaranthus tricolor]|uniref:uncharacterized protein LOC130807126 n=1 Tax=Amaranthus tricolor TaxID=29722 RepID=UPI00258D564A|nr:uncharacterized protein LOC130807126 [Amaranthus tricolor]
MGLPLINKIKAAIFPHQFLLQSERDDGQVGILKRDQVTARQCLINTLKRGASITPSKREREEESPIVMSVYLENPNTHERPHPIERYEVDMFEGKRINIGKDLPGPVKQHIMATLAEFRDVFALCLASLQDSSENENTPIGSPTLFSSRNQMESGGCVDFTDLNKACPKDDYPLPKIDHLVDSTTGHGLLSFMDANAGYHQIPLALEDQTHTAFITNTGV